MGQKQGFGAPLLGNREQENKRRRSRAISVWSLIAVLSFTFVGLLLYYSSQHWRVELQHKHEKHKEANDVVESEHGVVAADDGRCSEIGVSILREGGNAVDSAVATALCLGVVNPMSSGIGGGGFVIVHSSSISKAEAFDLRETAPLTASRNMYANDSNAKYKGALSLGVPGEIAGLYQAWLRYGRLSWKTLFKPAIKLAKDGFVVAPYLSAAIKRDERAVMSDPGLRQVFAPNGKVLQAGDTCHNIELARSLETIAEHGPQAFYNGSVGEKFVRDVRAAGGILAMEDMRNYKVKVSDAMAVDVMGYKILGMPPPSSGTLGMSLVLHILNSYGALENVTGSPSLHRLIEALKHMFAIRMNLGDPSFVNITTFVSDMLSPDFAKQLQKKIVDNTTFPPDYYLNRWSQLRDHGTSHFCIVDADRNAVSMTTTVNFGFGAGLLSPSTGIVLNNEMGDFSIPTEILADKLPPAPANFIEPNKRPLSSMTPIIILKDNQLAGVIGGSGGMYIIPAVIQVFINHFILGMKPLAAVQHPRVYHKLIPNVVLYENWTIIDGNHIELSKESKLFLKERGHELKGQPSGAICQLVVHNLKTKNKGGKKRSEFKDQVVRGTLTAVSDPRKDGKPAAL